MEFKDYYATLGVERGATAEAIKKAFRKLARKYHPDVSREPDAEARMKEVNEANAVLSDPEKRAAYDRLGTAYRPGQDFRPPPDWDAGFEFSDAGAPDLDDAQFSAFFSELFGRIHEPPGGRPGARGRRRSADHHAKIVLDIEDSLSGATRGITLTVPRAAPDGRVALATHEIAVKIPTGIRAGQVIRLAGQAGGGAGGAPAGDLYLEVHFRPHPALRADGPDLQMELALAPWEAALGAVVPVQLPHADLKVRIPEGAQSGKQLRVRGKGLPSNPPGDLLLELRIVAPPAATPRQRELYESMAREFEFDPRATVQAH